VRKSLYNNARAVLALSPANRTANAAVNGNTVDLNLDKQNFRNTMFAVHAGTIGDGSHAVTAQDSDDGAAWSDAPAEAVSGALPTITATDDDSVFEIGYLGARRYVRLVVTTTGVPTTGGLGGTVGAVALLGQPSVTPVSR
jgi:hypothetical protein